MNIQKQEKGFTIIEVVLVLAIAGLIFLMVFIALPALQRNQRDTQRKNDLGRASTALNSYQSNNRGGIPADQAGWTGFLGNYLTVGTDKFADPSFGDYAFVYKGAATATSPTPTDTVATSGEIWVYDHATCDGESVVPSSAKKVALAEKLEGGGIYCVNN